MTDDGQEATAAHPDQSRATLDAIRADIERVDRDLVALVARRLELARRVGEVKRAAGLPVLDPAQEAAVVRRAGEAARELGVDDEALRDVFWRLIALARRAQEGHP